jgi:UDP-glucose 4-epimerase
MRALITGGAGFIGSHLAARLIGLGHSVVIIDDLSTGTIDNIADLKSHARFGYYIDTMFNRPLMAELIDAADIVFHLAAAVGVRRIVDFPVRTIETNVKGAELVLELAAKKQKRVLITSTSEVYGKSTKVPFSEGDDLVMGSTYNSRWSYACSKAIDEFLALAYHKESKLPVTVLRLFNTTGPRQTGHYGMVVPTFVRQALVGEPITVFGTGEQSRCFCHVDDVIDGIVSCAGTKHTAGEIFNLGNTTEISIQKLAEMVIVATGSSVGIQYIPYQQAYGPGFEDMQRRVPNLKKANESFGYRPTRSLNDILTAVISYMRSTVSRNSDLSSESRPNLMTMVRGQSDQLR